MCRRILKELGTIQYSRVKEDERLIKILSLYRLTLGQPRQEELLEYLFKEIRDISELKKLFIDLSPFSKEKSLLDETFVTVIV